MFRKPLSLWVFAMAFLQPGNAEDTVSSGNYLIHLCNSEQPNSQASYLQALLPQIYDGLQNVIADLQRGTASTHGYSAFFKDDSSKAEVLQVYQKMAAGSNFIPKQSHYARRLRHPTFICANNIPETDLLYNLCQLHDETPLLYWRGTELMPLCPLFWIFKKHPAPSDCPLVIANTLTPNNDQLLRNQAAFIVSNLVHLYQNVSGPDLVLGIADASALNASSSLKNPSNYAFYYAAVQAGCNRFPDMTEPHDEFRRLLEAPVNASDTNAIQPIYYEIPSTVPIPPALDALQDFCNDAVYAPNATVCCNEDTGLWAPAPVIRDGPAASLVSASCPATTGGSGGVGAGSGVINYRRRRMVHAP